MGEISFFWSVVVGIIAGFLAGVLMRGRGFGCFINFLVGIVGSILGGWIFSLLQISVNGESILGTLVMSTLGAVVLLFLISLFKKKNNE